MTDLLDLMAEPRPAPTTPLAAIRQALDVLYTDVDAARDLLRVAVGQLTRPVTAPTEGIVRRDAAGTSRRAAAAVQVRTGTQRARVLLYVVHNGPATDQEIQLALGIGPSSERPRRVELVSSGSLVDSGRTRRHGDTDWTLWEPTDLGRAAAGELARSAS